MQLLGFEFQRKCLCVLAHLVLADQLMIVYLLYNLFIFMKSLYSFGYLRMFFAIRDNPV